MVDQCTYIKECGSGLILLVFQVDDILLSYSNISLLKETEEFISRNFDKKDLIETNYVIYIHIQFEKRLV